MGIVNDVHAWLAAEGLVNVSTPDGVRWPVSLRVLHDDVDEMVVLTEDGGEAPDIKAPNGLVGVGSSAMEDPGCQVRLRGAPYEGETTAAQARAILGGLHGQLDVVMGDNRYLRVRSLTSEPVYIGVDASGRPGFTVNIRAKRLA